MTQPHLRLPSPDRRVPRRRRRLLPLGALLAAVMATPACGDDDASALGVGGSCGSNSDCPDEAPTCLTNFKGGYCGIKDCKGDGDCPEGAGCVAHTDGTSYCFLICADKEECNENRGADEESNCSANVTFTSGRKGDKACVPPA